MKLAVIGSRTINNAELVTRVLDLYKEKISVIVTGGAKGVDKIAENWAIINNIPFVIHSPNWSKFGKSAGIIRNRSIANECDHCVAFWDGLSKGTKSTIDMCIKQKKKVDIFNAAIPSS